MKPNATIVQVLSHVYKLCQAMAQKDYIAAMLDTGS